MWYCRNMPRVARNIVGDQVYHVINRANERRTLFRDAEEYRLFEFLLSEAVTDTEMRLLAYVIMPNHWHLLLYPRDGVSMSTFMKWLTTTHAARVRHGTETVGVGHVYQGRYKSFLVDRDDYALTVVRYIERNPVRAGLVTQATDWKWGSAYRRIYGTKKEKSILADGPMELPSIGKYAQWLKDEDEDALGIIRESVRRGIRYGRS